MVLKKSTRRLLVHTSRMSVVMNVVKVKRKLHKLTANPLSIADSEPVSGVLRFRDACRSIHTKKYPTSP